MQILPYNKKSHGEKINLIINKRINGVAARKPKTLTE